MKKNMIKRALTVSLASLMAISSALPVNMLTASAAAQSGSCGEDIYWAFNPNGELTIYGSGVMDNFAQHKAPWKYTYTFERAVKKVTILDGVTNISCNAFSNLPNLTTVTIPDSVEIIKDGAFGGSTNLENVFMTPTTRVIRDGAFRDTKYEETYLTDETLPYMHYGSAGEMRGKQVVVNIFLNEVSASLPDLEEEVDQWTKLSDEEK
jgi:hypothetical protein